jgi:hypothetical protein
VVLEKKKEAVHYAWSIKAVPFSFLKKEIPVNWPFFLQTKRVSHPLRRTFINKKKRTQKLFSNVPPVERVVDVLPETGNDGTPTHMCNPP